VALGNPILYKLTYKDLGLFFKNSFHPKALFYPTQKHQFPPLPWGGSSTKYKNKNKKLIFIEKNKKKRNNKKKKDKKKDTKVFEPTRTIQICPTLYLIARPTYRHERGGWGAM